MIQGPLIPTEERLHDSIVTIIRNCWPFALCPRCIAQKLRIEERNVRSVMPLIVRTYDRFAMTTRVCHRCHTASMLLALKWEHP